MKCFDRAAQEFDIKQFSRVARATLRCESPQRAYRIADVASGVDDAVFDDQFAQLFDSVEFMKKNPEPTVALWRLTSNDLHQIAVKVSKIRKKIREKEGMTSTRNSLKSSSRKILVIVVLASQ